MATAQTHPGAVAGPNARHGSSTDVADRDHSVLDPRDHPDRHHPVRTALRGAGVFLDTTWRVLLLGSEGIDGVKR